MYPAADTSRVRDTNPLISILFFPRATIRHVVDSNPELYLAILITLAAFFSTLNRASGRGYGDRMPVWAIILIALISAPVAVPLSNVGAFIGEWLGEKLGGVATREEVRAMMAWSSVPAIAGGILFWPVQLTFFGGEMFRAETPLMDAANPFAMLALALLPLAFGIWSIIVAMHTFAEVHRFSAWRSLGAGLILIAIITVPLVALALLARAAT